MCDANVGVIMVLSDRVVNYILLPKLLDQVIDK